MISEGSCGTEDWSNNAEIHFFLYSEFGHILKYIQIYIKV